MGTSSKHIKPYPPIQKDKIRRYYYLGSGLAILLLVVLLAMVYSISLYRDYHQKIDQLSKAIIQEKKRFSMDAVKRTIYLIETVRARVREEFASQALAPEALEDICKDRIRHYIRGLRLIDDGYIWVNRIVDYRGGERYAVQEVHPNLPDTEGQPLSTETPDVLGNKPYRVELEGVKKNGELHYEYYFKKLSTDKIAHKLSYAKLYKPWDWVIATGVYLDDVDALVRQETQTMRDTLVRQAKYATVISVFGIFVSMIILTRFEKQISGLIRAYQEDIETYTAMLINEKEKTEAALAEVGQLKGMLPICSSCKKIRDDKGYWCQLEAYITDHSGAEFSHGICPDCRRRLYPDFDF